MTSPTKPKLNDNPVLSAATIGDINAGYFGIAIDSEIRRVISDCDAKPHVDKPRRITLVIDVTPLARPNVDEGAYGLVVTGAVSSKLPTFKADPSILDLNRRIERGNEILTAHFSKASREAEIFDGAPGNDANK